MKCVSFYLTVRPNESCEKKHQQHFTFASDLESVAGTFLMPIVLFWLKFSKPGHIFLATILCCRYLDNKVGEIFLSTFRVGKSLKLKIDVKFLAKLFPSRTPRRVVFRLKELRGDGSGEPQEKTASEGNIPTGDVHFDVEPYTTYKLSAINPKREAIFTQFYLR